MRRPSHSNDLRRRIVAAYVTKALVERVLHGDVTHHLGYEKHAPEGQHSGNISSARSCLRSMVTHEPNLIDTFF